MNICLENDIYLWLRWDNSCKQIRFKRQMLDHIAIEHNINPKNYKNKRVLLQAIMQLWEEKFKEDVQFRMDYEHNYGCIIYSD